MVETLPDGTPVSTTHFDFPTDNPGGLDIAPTSSTTDDPSAMSAWIVQRGVDNNSDPNEKDGKIFEVSMEAAPPPPPPGDNLLVNGDFESGSLGAAPPGWTSSPNFTTSDVDKHGGSFSGRHFSSADAGYTIEQTVNASAGETYGVSAWMNPITDDGRVHRELQDPVPDGQQGTQHGRDREDQQADARRVERLLHDGGGPSRHHQGPRLHGCQQPEDDGLRRRHQPHGAAVIPRDPMR